MATWTNIPDSVLEPGKPARSVDALALRDNAIAIAQGAAGAPKVTENAMSANSIHGNRLRSGTVANAQIANGAVNNVKIANVDASKITTGTIPGLRMPMAAGGVGTYAFLQMGATFTFGTSYPGANLRRSSTGGHYAPTAMSGTWRCMGQGSGSTVFVRIS